MWTGKRLTPLGAIAQVNVYPQSTVYRFQSNDTVITCVYYVCICTILYMYIWEWHAQCWDRGVGGWVGGMEVDFGR